MAQVLIEEFAEYNEFQHPTFWFLQLGEGFPLKNYPFSHVQFNEMGQVKSQPQGVLSVSFAKVFQKALECLRLKGDKEKEAWERLDKFLQTIDAMSFNTVSRREKEFNALFANEVVIPLTGSTCLINSKPEIKDEKGKMVKLTYDENLKLPEEMRKLSDDVKGLVIGSKRAYYGELDLIVFPPGSKGTDAARESKSVAVACSSERSSEESELKDNEKDDSPGKTVVEGKSTSEEKDGKGYHQAIAELFMFSQIQRLRHKDEGDEHAFPMLVVSPQDVTILIYKPESDTLLISEYLEWGRIAYFFVWAVLHHNIFPIKLPRGVKCGYQSIAPPLDLENVWYLCSKDVLHDEPPPLLTRKYWPSIYVS